MDTLELCLCRRLQGTLLAFFCLSALVLVVVYVAAPSIYTNTLSLMPSPTGHSPVAATLLLVSVGGFLAIVMMGVLRRWRWVFWLVLVATGSMMRPFHSRGKLLRLSEIKVLLEWSPIPHTGQVRVWRIARTNQAYQALANTGG
jgi:hypothetical protein